jgi:protein gp37
MAKQPKDGGITWTNETWNCIRGCSRVSTGCINCYAERMAARFSKIGQPYEGLAKMHDVTKVAPNGKKYLAGDPRWTGEVRFIPERLEDPIRWKRPRMIFVNSMSDLFHEKVPDEWLVKIFNVMVKAERHTFQCLTKRPERMMEWMNHLYEGRTAPAPPHNVWMGVSVENQETADYRIPLLLQTPAAVRWVSYEPALGPVDFSQIVMPDGDHVGNLSWYDHDADDEAKLNWIVVGGESGPGARPFDVQWARDTVKQCKAAGVACFVKQFGAHVITDGIAGPGETWPRGTGLLDTGEGHFRKHLSDSHGGNMEEWPEDLRVREFPS